jgi:hypothetical protein
MDNHNNKSDTTVKTSELGNGGESVQTLFIFYASIDLSNNLLQYHARALYHSVYSELLRM